MDLERNAIERMRFAAEMSLRIYKQPLVITYSGGKDSDVLLHLAGAAGIPYEVLHSLTTADAPETVWHVRDTFRRLELTGVRWAESQKRKSRGVMEALHRDKSKRLTLMNDNDESRMLMENCQLKGTRTINPIIDWQNADIWDYCTAEKISMNSLYACGFERVGCIGCPMAGKHRKVQFARYPKIKAAYIRAFDRMIAERQTRGLPCDWQTGEDVLHWSLEDGVLPGQMVFEGMEDI